jgi:hypothetical protein
MMAEIGRPTIRTPEMIEEIIERMEEGESLRKICEDEHMPHRRNVERWLADDPAFAAIYARARESQADLILEKMTRIEDDALQGSVEAAAASAVLNNQRWRAKVLAPKRYGDRQIVSGDKDADPVQVEAKTDYSRLSVEELRTLMALAEKAAITQER